MIVRFLQKIKRAAQKIHVLLTVCKIKKNRSVKNGSETMDFSQLSSIYSATAVSIRLPRVSKRPSDLMQIRPPKIARTAYCT